MSITDPILRGRRWLVLLVRFYRACEAGEHLTHVRQRASSKYLPPPYKPHRLHFFPAFLVDLTQLWIEVFMIKARAGLN